MLAGHVQDLLSLLRRQAAPDIPRCERESDGAETSAEARSHEAILAQALAVVPFAVALALLLVLAVAVAVVFLSLGRLGLVRRHGRRSRHGRLGDFFGLASVLLALFLSFALAV
jgi:hypothetical protein